MRSHQTGDKKYLIIGGEDHKSGHCRDTYKPLEALKKYAGKFFAVKDFAFSWSSQYFQSVDGLPYIGRMPNAPENVYVATGYGGNGMIFGTLAGRVLTELILSGKSIYGELFDPAGIKPVSGFSKFVGHNMGVITEKIKEAFNFKEIDGVHDLKNGEAKTGFYKGEKGAVYKDDAGEIHALKNKCTHAGCPIHWNTSEKSWDCFCHGSRFGVKGNVLNAPAVTNLEIIAPEKEKQP